MDTSTPAPTRLIDDSEKFSEAVQRLRAVAAWSESARGLAEALDYCYRLEGTTVSAQREYDKWQKLLADTRAAGEAATAQHITRLAELAAQVKATEAAAADRVSAANAGAAEAERHRAEAEQQLQITRDALAKLHAQVAAFAGANASATKESK